MAQVVLDRLRAQVERRRGLPRRRAPPSISAIRSSCGVSSSSEDGSRRRAVSPVACSSALARSAHGAAPSASNAASAARSGGARVGAAAGAAQALAEAQLGAGALEGVVLLLVQRERGREGVERHGIVGLGERDRAVRARERPRRPLASARPRARRRARAPRARPSRTSASASSGAGREVGVATARARRARAALASKAARAASRSPAPSASSPCACSAHASKNGMPNSRARPSAVRACSAARGSPRRASSRASAGERGDRVDAQPGLAGEPQRLLEVRGRLAPSAGSRALPDAEVEQRERQHADGAALAGERDRARERLVAARAGAQERGRDAEPARRAAESSRSAGVASISAAASREPVRGLRAALQHERGAQRDRRQPARAGLAGGRERDRAARQLLHVAAGAAAVERGEGRLGEHLGRLAPGLPRRRLGALGERPDRERHRAAPREHAAAQVRGLGALGGRRRWVAAPRRRAARARAGRRRRARRRRRPGAAAARAAADPGVSRAACSSAAAAAAWPPRPPAALGGRRQRAGHRLVGLERAGGGVPGARARVARGPAPRRRRGARRGARRAPRGRARPSA